MPRTLLRHRCGDQPSFPILDTKAPTIVQKRSSTCSCRSASARRAGRYSFRRSETVTSQDFRRTIRRCGAVQRWADRGPDQPAASLDGGRSAFDNAIDPQAAKIKGAIKSEVAGPRPQILVVAPILEAGKYAGKRKPESISRPGPMAAGDRPSARRVPIVFDLAGPISVLRSRDGPPAAACGCFYLRHATAGAMDCVAGVALQWIRFLVVQRRLLQRSNSQVFGV